MTRPVVVIPDLHGRADLLGEAVTHVQDTLGPDLVDIEEELNLQLLPEFPDAGNFYFEFNIAEKLKGSFEEQAASLQTMTGGPVLTVNEGRARLNLPRMDDPDCDRLIRPLNVAIGGQASPTDSAPPPKALNPGEETHAAN